MNLRERGSKQPLGTFAMDAFIAKLTEESMPTSRPLNTLTPWKASGEHSAKTGEASGPSAPQVASMPEVTDEPGVAPTGASSDGDEAVEENEEDQPGGSDSRLFDLGEKSWEEDLKVLDEDEAKAAEEIRRLREGKQ